MAQSSGNKTLASIKPEISSALSSLIDELHSIENTKVHRTGTYPARPNKPRRAFKSCTLCKAAGRPSATTHNLSECKLLPEGDRRALARSHSIVNEDIEDGYSDDEEEQGEGLLDVVTARRVEIISSPVLNVYFGTHTCPLTLDSGATSTMVRASFARKV